MTTTAEKPSSEVRKALADAERMQADADAAQARVAELAEADEAEVRRTIAAELQAEHAAGVEALKAARVHVEKVVALVESLNEMDAGRKARPSTGTGPGRRIKVPLPAGWKDLAGVLEGALVPLGPLPAVSPTLLHDEVRGLADEVHTMTVRGQLDWQDPQWRGVWSMAVKENRSLGETLQVKADLERMRDHGQGQPKEKDA